MALLRLQKFLSQAGACSRRKGEEHILAGNVTVNGQPVTTLGTKVDPERDFVQLNGVAVGRTDPHVYVMLNKPAGVVSSCDHRGERVVTDLIDLAQRLFPVGRLDRESTGLLLLTNDGRIHHRLSHPSFDHEKEYEVTVQWPVEEDALNAMRKGISLSGVTTRPARVTRLSKRKFRIVLKEGRNRQIRRMAKAVGNRVVALHRTRVANVKLGKLESGRWRHLTEDEVERLLKRLGLQICYRSRP